MKQIVSKNLRIVHLPEQYKGIWVRVNFTTQHYTNEIYCCYRGAEPHIAGDSPKNLNSGGWQRGYLQIYAFMQIWSPLY